MSCRRWGHWSVGKQCLWGSRGTQGSEFPARLGPLDCYGHRSPVLIFSPSCLFTTTMCSSSWPADWLAFLCDSYVSAT